MQISYLALVGWVVPLGAIVFGLGAYPTIQVSGPVGLRAQMLAFAVVMTTVLASGWIVCRASRGGPGRAAVGFIFSSMGRIVVAVVLGLAAWRVWGLPMVPLFVWLVIFYVALLIGEAIWLTRALRRDAFLEALGELEER